MERNAKVYALLKQIEKKYAETWGNSETWTHSRFEELSENIFEITKAKLSSSTLKRFFGKKDVEVIPSITTLNILAQFLGYKNWTVFQKSFKESKRKFCQKRTIL